MVQQPFIVGAGQTSAAEQQQQQQVNLMHQPEYSPQQANYYQQTRQQTAQMQQTASQQAANNQLANHKTNGLPINGNGSPIVNQTQQQQQYTGTQPTSHQLKNLYNGPSPQANRSAQVYAPQATYFSQTPSQQQMSLYQTSLSTNRNLQQGAYLQQVSPSGLSVRQLNGSSLNQTDQLNNSAGQQPQQAQLFMSYQQMPQLGQPFANQQQHVDVRWTQVDASRPSLDKQTQPLDEPPSHRDPPTDNKAYRSHRSVAVSDRDSISTLSRFNGQAPGGNLDERRSFAMRSQYTSHMSQRGAKPLGFLKLTFEALRRILGLGDTQTDGRYPKNLTSSLNQQSKSKSGANIQGQFSSGLQVSSPRIQSIDSGEDYYFKRKVFKYQLVIMRLISFVSAIIVLLSPAAMLLIPKMESLFRGQDFAPELMTSADQSQGHSSAPSITHAVGLSGPNKQQLGIRQQQPYYLPQPQWRISQCSSECDGPLIGFVARLIMLCLAYWAIFFRAQTASLPRVDFYRCLLSSGALLLTLAYWLFFVFRLFDKRYNDFELQYSTIVQFAVSMLESLILLHYLAVLLLELRHKKKIYCIKVIRSPDGASKYFSCGELSIQKCAQIVIEKYQRKFESFSSHADHKIQLEDKLAELIAGHRSRQEQESRSRAQSPANSISGARSSRRSRHRGSRQVDRSPSESPSPARSSSRSRRRSVPAHEPQDTANSSQVKLYQLDSCPPSIYKVGVAGDSRNEEPKKEESGGQSSDSTSRLKESSLDTIRAANSQSNSHSELLGPRPTPTEHQPANGTLRSRARESNMETESVRSARSRKSTSRSHSRRRDQPAQRSSSRQTQRDLNDRHQEPSGHSTSVLIPNDPIDEHERKVRRRKFRLLVSVQDAFEQIKRHFCEATTTTTTMDISVDGKPKMGAHQAARSLYPMIARPLQKYLRLTRQTGRHNLQSIHEHLSRCLLFKLSPRSFVEKFFNESPVWQQTETSLFSNCLLNDSPLGPSLASKSRDLELNSWSLVCDTLLSRQISSGTMFILRQGQVTLLVTVAKMPHLNLTEEVIDQNSCKFTIETSNSETSL